MVTDNSSIEKEIKEINWKFASENLDDDLHTDILFLSTSVGSLKEVAGVSYSHSLLFYEGHKGRFFYPDNEAQIINKTLIQRIRECPSWGEAINKQIVIKSIELENIWRPYQTLRDFSGFPTEVLFDLYHRQLIKHCELYQYAWIPEILQDSDYGIEQCIVDLSKKYDSSFTKKQILSLVPGKMNHTAYYKHDRRLLQIIENIQLSDNLRELFSGPAKYIRTSLPYDINRRIRQLINQYGYLGYHGYDERRPYDINYYIHLIKNYLDKPDEFCSLRKRVLSIPQTSPLWEKMTSDEKRLLTIYNNWGTTKARRRLAQLKNFFFLDKLIEEIAYRYYIPEDYIRFMTPKEIGNLFVSGRLPIGVERRSSSCCCFLSNKDIHILDGKKERDYLIKKSLNTLSPVILQGIIACEGYRRGKALLINRKSDYYSSYLEDCQVLVAREADPDIFCIFDKIVAIVTDQGGVTCHIASLAREYGIPCIVATQHATSIISQGDLVEVDAFNGFVKIIKQ